jgi:hypothetical protein
MGQFFLGPETVLTELAYTPTELLSDRNRILHSSYNRNNLLSPSTLDRRTLYRRRWHIYDVATGVAI